jgi:thioredoxin reductase (NADPH)
MSPASTDDRPVIYAVDDDAAAIGMLSSELERRYGRDYQVRCSQSPVDALAELEALHESGGRVALVLADQWMDGLAGSDLLTRVHDLHPHARRGLLIAWGDWGDEPTADAVRSAMALGHIDYYVLKPWKSPDELFHRTICEFLNEWWRTGTTAPHEVTLVADPATPRAHELRSLLARNGVPHLFLPRDSEAGIAQLRAFGQEGAREPVVGLLGGRVLVNPSNVELARGYGVTTDIDGETDFDVIVVGAGPAGLATAVYAASEGFSCLVVEREAIGGQAGSSSRIRNYLGFARGVSGAELAQRAYQQAWVFGTRFLLMRDAASLTPAEDGAVLTTSEGTALHARTVVLATGVSYVRLDVPGADDLTGAGVFYGASISEASQFTGRQVFVVGGGNSAGQAAIHLARYAAGVHLLVRGPSLAASMSRYLRDEIDAAPNITVQLSTEVVAAAGEHRLEQLTLRHRDTGTDEVVAADGMFVLIGARPHTEWLPPAIARDGYGFVVTGPDFDAEQSAAWPLAREPMRYETTVPGVFAVGDVRARSVKRVAAAVGEGSVVIQDIHRLLVPIG